MTSKKEFHIPINVEGKTAIDWLAEESGLSRQKLKQTMQKGCVWLERVKSKLDDNKSVDDTLKTSQLAQIEQAYVQRLRRAKKILNKNQILHFYYDESVLESEASPAILIEDLGDYSIWNKPSGMLSQGSKWGDHCTIYRWAEKQLKPERSAFIVHRLDRAANGLIILAHKKSVANQFSRMFEQRLIDKIYLVTVEGDFSPMIASEDVNAGILTINHDVDGKSAISHVRMIDFNKTENSSLLKIKIETGRKHQIRKHLSGLGFPVRGDRFYANKNENRIDLESVDLQLQAKSLKFICPISAEERSFTLDS